MIAGKIIYNLRENGRNYLHQRVAFQLDRNGNEIGVWIIRCFKK